MKHSYLLSIGFKILAFSLLPLSASATQPLETFLTAAQSHSFDSREQSATTEQRNWEKGAALGRLLPSFTARGTFTHNQYAAIVTLPGQPEPVTITPENQLDGLLQLDVPLVDVSSYHRYRQAGHAAAAADMQLELTGKDVQRSVGRAYYSFLGGSALVGAAEKSVALAEANLSYVGTRREIGVALDLDYQRAKANLERSKQELADAALMRDLAARNLETLTGIAPTEAGDDFPSDDLHTEGSMQEWLGVKDTPTRRVQARLDQAAASGRRAAATALLPTLSGMANERFTNAGGFIGRTEFYTLQAILQWKLDYGTYATAQAQSVASDVQAIRVERALRGVSDMIFEAYKRVETGIVKSQSARVQEAATQQAADLALERYQAGSATQLDVTQAQRDAFQARAARISADADLVFARLSLRATAGRPLDSAPPGASASTQGTP